MGQGPGAAGEKLKVSTHLVPPLHTHARAHTHTCLVLGMMFSLPLNFWIPGPSGHVLLPPSQPYTHNLTHSWSPKPFIHATEVY